MSVTRLAGLAVAVCLVSQPILSAQKGKGKPSDPVDTPAVAWFGTNGLHLPHPSEGDPDAAVDWDLDGCESGFNAGTINGDGAPYVEDLGAGIVSKLRSGDGEFVLQLPEGGTRGVYVNFTSVFAASTSPQPRKEFCALTVDRFHFNSHYLNQDGSDDVKKGLLDIADGETHPSRIRASFFVNGITYWIRFLAANNDGSSNVMVTRGPIYTPTLYLPNNQWWAIQTGYHPTATDSGAIAHLTSPQLTRKGNLGPNDEGLYELPFQIIFTIDPDVVNNPPPAPPSNP